MVIKVRFFIYC